MGRTRTTGLEYFQFDVDFESDPKIKAVKAWYGIVGVYTYVHLLCAIYREGYYINFAEDDIAILADEMRAEVSKVKEIIEYTVSRGLFDAETYAEHGVLTSKAIQKRWQFMTTERRKKGATYDVEYWLLTDDETANGIIPVKNDNRADIFPVKNDSVDIVYPEKNTHSIVQYSTVQDSIVKESKPASAEDAEKTSKKTEKHKYGLDKNVLLTDAELAGLKEKYGNDADSIIDFFSDKKAMNGYSYKSDYRAILNWGARAYYEAYPKQTKPTASFEEEEFYNAAVANSMQRHARAKQ